MPQSKIAKTGEGDRPILESLCRFEDEPEESDAGQDWISREVAFEEGAFLVYANEDAPALRGCLLRLTAILDVGH